MRRTIFYGWVIVGVTAIVLVATAGVRSAPGALPTATSGVRALA